MGQGRLRARRFWKDEGRTEAIQGAPLIIITGDWQSRPVRTDSARQPNRKAHLLLVSLNNEPVIWINGPPARLTLIMASLITRSEEQGMKMKGQKWGRWRVRGRFSKCPKVGVQTCLLTLMCLCFVLFSFNDRKLLKQGLELWLSWDTFIKYVFKWLWPSKDHKKESV